MRVSDTRHRKKAHSSEKSPRPLVSVCLIGKDEERFLDRALSSIADLADEIVFVDTGSHDRTLEIAKAHRARVFEIPWPNDFSAARNYSIDRARGRWIVVLDCDEEFPPGQAASLRGDIEKVGPGTVGIQISQANVRSVDDHRLVDSGKTIRVFRNTPAHRYQGPIHEQIAHSLTDGQIWNSPYYVWHYGFLADVVKDKAKIERNYLMLLDYLATLQPGGTLHSYVLSQLGRECQRMGKPNDADPYFRLSLEAVKVTEADPTAPHFPYFDALSVYYAENLLQLGKSEEAAEFCLQRLQVSPWLADLWFFLGYAELIQEKTAIGITHLLWSTAVADVRRQQQEFFSPSRSITAYQNAALALSRLGAPDAGLQLLLSVSKDVPEDPGMVAKISDLLLQAPHAIPAVQALVPEPMLWPLMQHLFAVGAYDLVRSLARARFTDDPNPTVRFWLATDALHTGDPARAISLLDGIDTRNEVGAYAQLARVVAYRRSGRHDELASFLSTAPQDLYHALQRELAGIPSGEFLEGYAVYRAHFAPLVNFWGQEVAASSTN